MWPQLARACSYFARSSGLFVAALLLLTLLTASAETRAAAAPAVAAPAVAASADVAHAEKVPEEVAENSPRAAISRFLGACREGRFDEAAEYLQFPTNLRGREAELARKLKLVLDRHLWLDASAVSPLATGSDDDKLGPNSDELGTVPGTNGHPEPVRLSRVVRGGELRWVFSSATVSRVDEWYGQLGQRWVIENVPAPLQKSGPFDVLYWQWLALPLLAAGATLLALLLTRVTRSLLGRLARGTAVEWDDQVVARSRGPLRLAWSTLIGFAVLPWLGLNLPARDAVHGLLRSLLLLSVFWGILRVLNIFAELAGRSSWGMHHAASRALIPLGMRVAKVAAWAVAIVVLLAEFDYPVGSLLAGLGIGGLALALAAQKTVENLFGAFSIGIDQPFREGDTVHIEDFTGTVEAIGLRSTKVRTADRTVISIPNGKLAEMRVESFAPRDRIRFGMNVSLAHGTSAEQMRTVLGGLERVLREQPKLWPDGVSVQFKEIGESSLDIEVNAWFATADFNEFQNYRQQVLLGFMAVVDAAGTSFAHPTRTVHLWRQERSEARAETAAAHGPRTD